MSTAPTFSYVLQSTDGLPLHLKDRAPFTLLNTEAIFRRPEDEVVGPEGRVLMAGAIEFQTQITPTLLTDVCDPEEIFKPEMRATHRFRCVYDPEIQRGVKETASGSVKEFLRESQIKSMMEDIDQNRFECPQLMWNLRVGESVWAYIRDARELRIYEGVATRPDTNHRHHAIVRFHRQYIKWQRETGSAVMGSYNPARAYGLVIYTDDYDGEAHRFFVYNFKGWRVPTSTAHYIESKTATPNLHSRLARELMEQSSVLGAANVELLGNQLSRNSAKMITFGTFVEALRTGFPELTDDDYESVKTFMLDFLAGLNTVRPAEIALLSVSQRQRVRNASVADQAVMWHAYIRLAARCMEDNINWGKVLQALAEPYTSLDADQKPKWTGDLFSRNNPVWSECGMIAPGKTGPRVVNNRESRQESFELLCKVTGVSPRRDFLDKMIADGRDAGRKLGMTDEQLKEAFGE